VSYSLLIDLCESRLIPSRNSLTKWDAKSLRDLSYLYFLALRILIADSETKTWAMHYAEKTAQASNFDQWRTDGNDLYVMLYALSSDAEFDDAKCSISTSSVRDWLRHGKSNDFDARTHKLFNRLDGMFHVTTSAFKTMRRVVSHWPEADAREQQSVLTDIIQQIHKLAPSNCELLAHLKKISIDDIVESATSGATSVASVTTTVGGLGSGFDANQKWRGIYDKKPKSKVKTVLIRR
jgi:hypothetical protein